MNWITRNRRKKAKDYFQMESCLRKIGFPKECAYAIMNNSQKGL